MASLLQEKYNKKVIPLMKEKFGYKSIMAVPKIEKVVVSAGFGKIAASKTNDEQKKITESIMDGLMIIAGQKPALARAKKSISTFKLRQGMPIGAKVVLRGKKMYDFLERTISVAIPRVRDFRGIDLKGFDKQGNLTIGFKEHTIFPEIAPEKAKLNFGFEITIVTNAGSEKKGTELLRLLGFPLKKD